MAGDLLEAVKITGAIHDITEPEKDHLHQLPGNIKRGRHVKEGGENHLQNRCTSTTQHNARSLL